MRMKLGMKLFVTRVFLIPSVLGTMFVGCLLLANGSHYSDEHIDNFYKNSDDEKSVECNIADEEKLPGEPYITCGHEHFWLNDKNDGSLYVAGDCGPHALARWVHQVCRRYEGEREIFDNFSREEKEKYEDKWGWKDSFSAGRNYSDVWRECLPADFRKKLEGGSREPRRYVRFDDMLIVEKEIRGRYPGLFGRFELKFRFTKSCVEDFFEKSGMVCTLNSAAKYAKESLLSATDCIEIVQEMGVGLSEKEDKQMFADDQFAEGICEKIVNKFVGRFFSGNGEEQLFVIAHDTVENLRNRAFDRIIGKLKEKYSYERLDDALEKLKEKYLTSRIPDEILEGGWSQTKPDGYKGTDESVKNEKLIYFFNVFKTIIKGDFDEKKYEHYEIFTDDLFGSDIFLDLARITKELNGAGANP